MSILDKMAKAGGDEGGSRNNNRSDYQLHYAMYLYLNEYIKDEKSNFKVFLDFADDVSLVKDGRVCFYQVKTSDILSALSDVILCGDKSEYIVNLYKHIKRLGSEYIKQLYLVSNVKFKVSGKLLKEVGLDNFPEKAKDNIIQKIKQELKVDNFDDNFIAITSCLHCDMPLGSFSTHIKGKIQDVIGLKLTDSNYGQGAIYDTLKKHFDAQNNFEDFSKIKNAKTLSEHKGVDAKFLQRIIKIMK